MLLDANDEQRVARLVYQVAGRSTFPLRLPGAQLESGFGTAFLFNELVDSTPAGDRVREYLLTADVLTRAPVGLVGLRPELTEPAGVAADELVLAEYEERWVHRPDLGVAIMPTLDMHDHGRRKRWRWATQQITEGLAARAETVARIDAQPISAFALGHRATASLGSSHPEIAVGRVFRDDAGIRFSASLPRGYVGAPVFTMDHIAGSDVALRCVGLVLPGDGGQPLATFDHVRAAVAAVTPDR